MSKKIDQLIFERKLVRSRTFAQELIKEQQVSILSQGEWVLVKKPSQLVSEDVEIRINENPLNKYVSRAGLKLDGALNRLNVDVTNKICLDIGASTGGFTDCLLQRGADQIVSIDVGQGQLDLKISRNPKVHSLEKINARNLLDYKEFLEVYPEGGFDVVVMDVSFISMTLILNSIQKVLKKDGLLISLVKPQFELGPENLDKHGIVKNSLLFSELQSKIEKSINENNLQYLNYIESPIEGKDGNKEFFVYAKK